MPCVTPGCSVGLLAALIPAGAEGVKRAEGAGGGAAGAAGTLVGEQSGTVRGWGHGDRGMGTGMRTEMGHR